MEGWNIGEAVAVREDGHQRTITSYDEVTAMLWSLMTTWQSSQ